MFLKGPGAEAHRRAGNIKVPEHQAQSYFYLHLGDVKILFEINGSFFFLNIQALPVQSREMVLNNGVVGKFDSR